MLTTITSCTTHSVIPARIERVVCSCFNQQEASERERPSAPPTADATQLASAAATEPAVFCLPSGEREGGNITRFSASDQIPSSELIQLDTDYGYIRIWSGNCGGGGGGRIGFVVENVGMNKKMESEGNVIFPCLAHVKSALSHPPFPLCEKTFFTQALRGRSAIRIRRPTGNEAGANYMIYLFRYLAT